MILIRKIKTLNIWIYCNLNGYCTNRFRKNNLKKYKGYQDIIKRVPDVTKLRKMTNWKPKIDLDKGLKLFIEDIKKLLQTIHFIQFPE